MAISDSDVETLAKRAKSVMTIDEGQIVERSVDELIQAEEHVATKTTIENPAHGMIISRIKPGGTL